MMDDKYIQLSQKQTEKARMVISSLNLIEIWEKAGATINSVGSFRIGVLAKHRDIDFHIYTDSLDIGRSFAIIAELCRHKGIKKCTFANLAETDECCFEWHLYYEDDEAQTWQIDLIQIKKALSMTAILKKQPKNNRRHDRRTAQNNPALEI